MSDKKRKHTIGWLLPIAIVLAFVFIVIWLVSLYEGDSYQPQSLSSGSTYFTAHGERFSYAIGGPMFLYSSVLSGFYVPRDPCAPLDPCASFVNSNCFDRIVCISPDSVQWFFEQSETKELDISAYVLWHLGEFSGLENSIPDVEKIQELLDLFPMNSPRPVLSIEDPCRVVDPCDVETEPFLVSGKRFTIIFVRTDNRGIGVRIRVDVEGGVAYSDNGEGLGVPYPGLFEWLDEQGFIESMLWLEE